MPENLVWKYQDHRNDPRYGEKSDEWALFFGSNDIAKFYRPSPEFMKKHGIGRPIFVFRNGYDAFLPWSEIEQNVDCDVLFELSDKGAFEIKHSELINA